VRQRSAVVVSADAGLRHSIGHSLTGLRWQVRHAASGAEAWPEINALLPEVFIVDSWLPDLEASELINEMAASFPEVDLLHPDGTPAGSGIRCSHRAEVLYALRASQETDTAAWNTAPESISGFVSKRRTEPGRPAPGRTPSSPADVPAEAIRAQSSVPGAAPAQAPASAPDGLDRLRLPEMIGDAPAMLEVSRRVRLVAPRSTPVLVEGPTGSGKELVAQALHRLSSRSRKPFVAINCAAIPEALLEAELFGHTRGAFTGAVQGRTGRIEAADGGTLFLDEIGEMPLALQSKLLRFVECGELQRVGDNETVKVDVRIVAATHCPLVRHAQLGSFRADLYYRLAVFLIRTPALASHLEDLPGLVEHFLEKMGRTEPVKRIDEAAMKRLAAHDWPGNVRELEHVLERAAILAGDAPVLTVDEIEFGPVVDHGTAD
jgi:DNA-binding NtrC family response regulator